MEGRIFGLFEPTWFESACDARRDQWGRLLPESVSGGMEVLVAEAGGEVIGFTHFGPCEEDMAAGEVFALYVHPGHWGTGAAQLLTHCAIERLKATGFQRVVLWTPSGANRARAFYERNGWGPTGQSVDQDFGDGRPKQVVEYSRKM